MKNLFKLALMVLAMSMFVACGPKTTETETPAEDTVVTEAPVEEAPVMDDTTMTMEEGETAEAVTE